ncbi:MAG: hypothetical protein QM723_25465 [Myxococcaceae bacterium]
MKKLLVVAAFAAALSGCSSVETATVNASDFVASGGEAWGIVQVETIGISAIFHLIDIVPADLDMVQKDIVKEAKNMGATKVQLLSASTTPRHGIFALAGGIIGFPTAQATGVAVK